MNGLWKKPALVVAAAVMTVLGATGVAATRDNRGTNQLVTVNQTVNAAQMQTLEDRRVTPDEYDQAIATAIECATDSGVQVEGPQIDATGLRLQYAAFAIGLDESNEADRIFADCYDEHARLVDIAYQISPEIAVATTARSELLVSCISEENPATAATSIEELMATATPETVRDCALTLPTSRPTASVDTDKLLLGVEYQE